MRQRPTDDPSSSSSPEYSSESEEDLGESEVNQNNQVQTSGRLQRRTPVVDDESEEEKQLHATKGPREGSKKKGSQEEKLPNYPNWHPAQSKDDLELYELAQQQEKQLYNEQILMQQNIKIESMRPMANRFERVTNQTQLDSFSSRVFSCIYHD